MKKIIFPILFVLGLFVPPVSTHALLIPTFTRDLGIGSRGTEVVSLQSFLSWNGYISSEYVTGYFGKITSAAVKSFQEKYKAQILSPLGLNQGTGFVGAKTRLVLNNLVYGDVNPGSPVSTYSINPASGAVGTVVTITGSGFALTGNSVLSNGLELANNVSSSNGTSLTFIIPSGAAYYCPVQMATIPCPMSYRAITAGEYPLTVVNTNGISNIQTFTVTAPTLPVSH